MTPSYVRRVVCAALRYGPMLVVGPRHYDATMQAQITLHKAAMRHPDMSDMRWGMAEQGFIDQKGIFMTREEAYQVAKAAGQIVKGPHLAHLDPPQLDSSDLY